MKNWNISNEYDSHQHRAFPLIPEVYFSPFGKMLQLALSNAVLRSNKTSLEMSPLPEAIRRFVTFTNNVSAL